MHSAPRGVEAYTVAMSLREYVLILLVGTCAATIGWLVILVSVNPFSAGLFGFCAFYLTLLFMSTGWIATLGTLFRSRHVEAHDEAGILHVLLRSLRQGALLGAMVCLGCIALAAGWFSLGIFFVAIFALALGEFIFLFWEERHVARVLRRG